LLATTCCPAGWSIPVVYVRIKVFKLEVIAGNIPIVNAFASSSGAKIFAIQNIF